MKKVLIINGSPKKDGNTAILIDWFKEGALSNNANLEIVHVNSLKIKFPGCMSCRQCQTKEKYECVINDDVTKVLAKMALVDVIVMATPLYFFSSSAQIKIIFDRMFSLYKWDNTAGTMKTILKGRTFAVLASAYENVGLDVLEKPFALTADYSGMKFASLLVADAGVSGGLKDKTFIKEKAIAFGKSIS